MKFTHSAVGLILIFPWVCSHHIFAVRSLILKCLTGSYMTILSKSNYRVRLNVNTDITDSISFYFNFWKGYHFVLRLLQHFFDKVRLFKMNRVNPAIIDWREEEVETRRSLSFESFAGKTKSKQKDNFLRPYDCTTVQGATFNMRGQLYGKKKCELRF